MIRQKKNSSRLELEAEKSPSKEKLGKSNAPRVRASSSLTSSVVPTESPRERIVRAVLLDVLEGKLPAGHRLITEQLAQRFDVSHTPIREALLTLAGMGVVQLLPNRGALVKDFSPREIKEIWDVRLALEVAAVRSACGRIPDSELQKLETQLRRLAGTNVKITSKEVRLATQLDTQIHTLIRNHARNQFLANELTRIHSLIVVIRDAAWKSLVQSKNLNRVVEESEQHLEIVLALRALDGPRAARAMRTHLRTGKSTIVKAVQS